MGERGVDQPTDAPDTVRILLGSLFCCVLGVLLLAQNTLEFFNAM
jgi:hypothetical protein